MTPIQNIDLQHLSGIIVIISPHMDDEALACGGLIAKLPGKNRIHIIYATDGMKSPEPLKQEDISPDLGKIRVQESKDAMDLLGVPEQNLHFLCLPDAQLAENISALRKVLREKLKQIAPQYILIPFRYDQSSDHLAVNRVVASDLEQGIIQAKPVEYFVYYRYRLLPRRDIRKYIEPKLLYKLDITDVAVQKRQSLNCFVSQTTIYYPWQTRPILTSKLLEEECQNPEYFLISNGSHAGTCVFINSILWIRLVHRFEPVMKRWKDLAGAFLKTILN